MEVSSKEPMEWRKEVYHEWPYCIEEIRLKSLVDCLKRRLESNKVQYEVILDDGTCVRLNEYNRLVEFLNEETSKKCKIGSIILYCENGPSRAIKVVLNRMLLSALFTTELRLQLAAISYSVVAPSRDDRTLYLHDINKILNQMRQKGLSKIFSTIGINPVSWFIVIFFIFLIVLVLGFLAMLEISPENTFTRFIRDREDLYFILTLIIFLSLLFIPPLFRRFYPFAIFKFGWENEYIKKTKSLRSRIFWGVIIPLLISGFVTIAWKLLF